MRAIRRLRSRLVVGMTLAVILVILAAALWPSTPREELLRDGFQEYVRQQWYSPEITIIVVSNPSGETVCRYKGEGVAAKPWLDAFRSWLSRRF
jgi:hypothetical protein